MKIYYFAGEAWESDYIRTKLPNEDIVFKEGPFSSYPELTDALAEVLCVFVESPVTNADMARFPALKLILTRSTGFDHIDLAAASSRGIQVASVPSYGENTVAEFTLGLMLALSRKILAARDAVRREGTFAQNGLRGFDLAGKTLGVVGTGRIGAHIIRMAQGCSMNVVAYDAYPNSELAGKLGFPYVALTDLLASSDIITLHVPYNKETHHLIHAGNVGSIKKGAYLINTSRGAVVETGALLAALNDGTLAGAGLDVLEEEGQLADPSLPLSAQNRALINHPNVIVTPHVAFDTTEAIRRILDTTVDNFLSFVAGSPKNIVS